MAKTKQGAIHIIQLYFSVGVYANDKLIGCLDNFSDQTLPEDYSEITFPVGELFKTFDLGEGEKTVTVHLPWCKNLCDHADMASQLAGDHSCWCFLGH